MPLSLNLLGVPEIRSNDRVVVFPTRKTLALLVYLAVEGGIQSREKITALFWPESDSSQGRTSLRKTLSYLRQSLGSESAHIISDRESLSLDLTAGVELDTRIVEAAAHSTFDDVGQLARSASLYRGDFLEGFSLGDAPDFDDWAGVWREALHRRAILILDKLSQARFDRGDLVGALDTCRRWLAADSLDESAYRRIMQLHLAGGDRSAALEAYQACRAVLQRELDVEPTLETQRLAGRIRESQGVPNQPRPSKASAETAYPGTPLIGRASEFGQLVAAYRLAQAGHVKVVAVEGEPGIGKTRLAREFLAWAVGQGAGVLQGGALETSNRLPYQPWIEALRGYLNEEANLQRLTGDIWIAELSRLLPELREMLPDLPTPIQTSEAEAQARLFEAIVKTLEAFTQFAPVVLFLDDLQWADTGSLEFLQYALRRWSQQPAGILLILAIRSEDLAASSFLSNWFNLFGRDLPLERLNLGTLIFQDTRQLAQSMGQLDKWEPPSNFDEFCRQLYAGIGGHPLIVIQTLHSLSERGLLKSDQAGAWSLEMMNAIPSGVRDLIRGRLAHLSPNAQMICTTGAVLGGGFEFDQICRVANLNEENGLSALEELLARGLLQGSNRRYYFTHDRIREVAYSDLSETRRLVMHRRALELLSLPPGESLLHARAIGEQRRVFELALSAGDEALKLFAVHDAVSYYEQAQDVIPAAPDDAARTRLYSQFGRACELLNDWSRASTKYGAMLALAREKGDPAMEGAALNRLANLILQESFDLGETLSLLKQAQGLAEKSGDKSLLAETESNLAQIHMFLWKPGIALEHAQRSLALGTELNKPELIAHSLNTSAYSHLLQGDWEAAADYGAQASRMYVRLHNRALEADSLCIAAYAAILAGRAQEGIRTARTANEISVEIENQWGQANSFFHLALGLLEAGDYQGALEAAQNGVEIATRLNHRPLQVLNLMALGNVYRALFALEDALRTHRAAKATRDLIGSHPYADILAAELCADSALAGDWDQAFTFAKKALADRDYDTLYVNLTRWHETEALVRAGQLTLAVEDVRKFGERVDGNLRYRIPLLRSRAVLAAHAEANGEAIEYLQQALSLARELSLPGEEWQLLSALGEMHRAQGLEAQAHMDFLKACHIVQKLAENIRDDRLHDLFIASKQVQFVLAQAK